MPSQPRATATATTTTTRHYTYTAHAHRARSAQALHRVPYAAPRHPNCTFSGQLISGQFPRKAVPGMHIPRRKRKTAKGQGEVGFLRYSPYGPWLLGCQHGKYHIFFPEYPSTTTFRNTLQCISPYLPPPSSDAQNITLFFLRVPSCVGVLMPTSFTRMCGCELELNADIFMNATYLEGPSEC
jgi:hypothetical protein